MDEGEKSRTLLKANLSPLPHERVLDLADQAGDSDSRREKEEIGRSSSLEVFTEHG